jgi:hypothetical protein
MQVRDVYRVVEAVAGGGPAWIGRPRGASAHPGVTSFRKKLMSLRPNRFATRAAVSASTWSTKAVRPRVRDWPSCGWWAGAATAA